MCRFDRLTTSRKNLKNWSTFTVFLLAIQFVVAPYAWAGSLVGWGQGDNPDSNDLIAVSAGSAHNLAIKSDGSIVGWGDNAWRQADPPAGSDFTAVAAGSSYGLALKRTVLPEIAAQMKLTPHALNCKSRGRPLGGRLVTAQLLLPEGISPQDIDVDTPATAEPIGAVSEYIKVFGGGPVRLEIGFAREVFCGGIADSSDLEITVIGSLKTGQKFSAVDTIKLILR